MGSRQASMLQLRISQSLTRSISRCPGVAAVTAQGGFLARSRQIRRGESIANQRYTTHSFSSAYDSKIETPFSLNASYQLYRVRDRRSKKKGIMVELKTTEFGRIGNRPATRASDGYDGKILHQVAKYLLLWVRYLEINPW